MKKYLIFILLLFIVGCSDSDNVSVYNTYGSEEKSIKEEEVVTPNVIIYGFNDAVKGYVIDVEKYNKFIVTVASSVVGHPKVLVETSTGQLVKGEVVAIDQEHNMAIIFMKLTTDIEPYHLSSRIVDEVPNKSVSDAYIQDEKELEGIFSVQKVDEQFQTIFVNSEKIQQLLSKGKEQPISYEERFAAISYFSEYPKVNVRENTPIATYNGEMFTYNPDEIYVFLNQFQKALNQYFEQGDRSLIETYIASDDLFRNIQQMAESNTGIKQFGELEFTKLSKHDFQYMVEGKTSLNIDGVEGTLKATFKCILMNGEWKLVSVYYTK